MVDVQLLGSCLCYPECCLQILKILNDFWAIWLLFGIIQSGFGNWDPGPWQLGDGRKTFANEDEDRPYGSFSAISSSVSCCVQCYLSLAPISKKHSSTGFTKSYSSEEMVTMLTVQQMVQKPDGYVSRGRSSRRLWAEATACSVSQSTGQIAPASSFACLGSKFWNPKTMRLKEQTEQTPKTAGLKIY